MNYRFEILTCVFFKHTYFQNEKFEELKVQPPGAGMYMMTRMGLLFKAYKDGFSILYDTNFAGRQREKHDILSGEPFILRFYLLLNAPAFYNYTADVSGDLTKSVFYFTNSTPDSEQTAAGGILHAGKTVSEKDLYPLEKFQGQFFSKPFGVLDLQIHGTLKETYVINFSAKATFWRYIIVSDHLKDLHQPAVLNPDDHEIFDGPAALTLPDEKEALAFTSKTRINLSESIASPMQLVEHYEAQTGKYKTIIAALPLPDIHTISRIGPLHEHKTESEFSEIFIY